MIRIYCIDPQANKWVYEYNGEIIAVEYSREMAVACGEARIKAMKAEQK